MNLRQKLIVAGLTLFVLCSGTLIWDYWKELPVDYVPVVRVEKGDLVESSALATPEHLNRLEPVLRFYNIWYERTDSRHIRIRRGLAWDTATLASYTSQAEDETWPLTHQP